MRKGAKQLAIGTAIAAGIGYVAGVLTAPKSGRETRKDIKNAAVKAKKEAEKKLKALHSDLSKLIDSAQGQLSKASAKTKKEFGEALNRAKLAKQKVREMLSAVHEGDAEDEDLKAAIDEATKAVKRLKKYIKKDGPKTSATS